MPGVPLCHYHQHGVRAVLAWCDNCNHNAQVDLDMLIEKLGPDHLVTEVGRHMKCSACGSGDITTRPAWPKMVKKG